MPVDQPPSPLGAELRWMRGIAALPGRALADRLGISQPFLSQVETGSRRPAVSLVERWLQQCTDEVRRRTRDDSLTVREHRELLAAAERIESEDYALAILRMAEDANTEVVSNFTITRTGLAARQERILSWDRAAVRLLHFQPLMCPGPLQTLEFAKLVFAGHGRSAAMNGMTEKDRLTALDAAQKARVKRSRWLQSHGGPDYEIILTEHALDLTLVGSGSQTLRDLMANIAKIAAMGRIGVRVIPRDAQFDYVPVCGFYVYEFGDQSALAVVETYAAQVEFTAPRDVRRYLEAWQSLNEIALGKEETIKWLNERRLP